MQGEKHSDARRRNKEADHVHNFPSKAQKRHCIMAYPCAWPEVLFAQSLTHSRDLDCWRQKKTHSAAGVNHDIQSNRRMHCNCRKRCIITIANELPAACNLRKLLRQDGTPALMMGLRL
jgi:hypothetical protein